jgi:hypothetical protein
MSIQVSNAVWQHSQSTGRARLVLLAIADHQGEIGAWPSLKTLAKMVNSSERSVQRDIQTLQELGELSVEIQNAPTKQQYKSNLYWVTLAGVTDLRSGVTNAQSGVTESSSGVTAGGVQTLIEPLLEPLPNLRDSEEEEFLKSFNQFWELYPKKIDKGRAVKDFRSALKRASFESIIAGVRAYKDDPYRKPQFTKYPSSWLNADAWENFITSSEARVATEERRSKDLAYKDQFLADQRSQEALSAPAPKCQHGNTIALCRRCLS